MGEGDFGVFFLRFFYLIFFLHFLIRLKLLKNEGIYKLKNKLQVLQK